MSKIQSGLYQNLNIGLVGFKEQRKQAILDVNQAAISIGLFFIPHTSYLMIRRALNSYFERIQVQVAMDALRDRYFEGEVAMMLSQDEDTEAWVNQMYMNVYKVAAHGSSIGSSVIKAYVGGIYEMSYLFAMGVSDMVAYMSLYNRATESVTLSLNEGHQQYLQELDNIGAKMAAIRAEFKRHAIEIDSGRLKEMMADRQRFFEAELRQQMGKVSLNHYLLSTWDESRGTLDYLVRNLLVAQRLYDGGIRFEDYLTILRSTSEVSDAVSWYADNAISLTEFNKSATAIEGLLSK